MRTKEAKADYESLIAYFKLLVWISAGAIVVIAGVGMFFTYSNVSDLRSQARESIDEVFKTESVQAMVESAARRQVGTVIDQQVSESVDQAMEVLKADITTIGQLADLALRARIGYRSAIDGLIAMAENAPNDEARSRAEELLERIGTDYEQVMIIRIGSQDSPGIARPGEFYNPEKWEGDESAIAHWVNNMRTTADVYGLTSAFLALRDLTDYQFTMFDVGAVEKWCVEHQPVCDQTLAPATSSID